MTRIGAIGKVVTGKTPSTKNKDNYGSGYMFIGPSDLHKHFIVRDSIKNITQQGFDSVKSSSIKGRSILVGCIGWDLGNVAMTEVKCVTNQQINSITDFKPDYNPFYVYYWLKHKKQFLFDQANVTRTPILNKTNFSNIEIPIPAKSYQDIIVDTLIKIDQKIELNNRINAELESMAKTIYDYWFIQFDFPNENGKPYKSSGGKMVWSEELKREIPEGWEVKNVKDNSLTSLIKPGIDFFEGERTYLATADVVNNEINFGADKITYENRESRANMQPIINSIWFAKMKKSKKVLYVGEYADYFLKNLILSTGFAGLECRENYFLEYVWGFINNDNFEIIKDRLSNGATQEAINNESMAIIPLIIPSENILNKYHKKTFGIYKKIYFNQVENQKLAELRDWLLPMLMNGQVTIRN